ncbi:MAG: abortive phage infection protein [Lachnospiraceae bacterium]|nr:abortive phage infection protein [Lachnospiraceae bacterium]
MVKTMYIKKGSFRKLEDPFNSASKKYLFYVKVGDIPESIPMKTNPRHQTLTSMVPQAITESLESNDGYFHLKNRGIVLSAKACTYNSKAGKVTITFADNAFHGNIDGGHTYKILCEHRNSCLDQYVQFEVMTGVEEIIEGLAEARNTSVQVDEKSMAELQQKFDPIKEGLEGMPFFARIAFKQNQQAFDNDTNKKLKMIDAREIVAIINMFNVKNFDATNHPIKAYASKAKMLNLYLNDPESYRNYVNIMPDIFDLYDTIEMEFATAFNEAGGRYGRKKYSGYKDGTTIGTSKFGLHNISYKIPDGLIYPTVAAFRSLIVYNPRTEKYEWKNGINPIHIWSKCKRNLTYQIMCFASAIGDNPNTVGKSPNIWNLAYMTVLLSTGDELK